MSSFIQEPEISGLFLLKNFYAEDLRGNFIKVYQQNQLPPDIAGINFRECFITSSRKNVLRGMHFQLPPYSLDKLATVVHGDVLDVIFDMRKNSPTFGKSFGIKLGDNHQWRTVFIPSGCAHGFLALSDDAVMLYQTTCEFHPASDSGIRYDSIGYQWPVEEKDIIITEKDLSLSAWSPERSPF